MTHFWLSFADPTKTPGTQFLGGCLVEAVDVADAVATAGAAGCNPGGEVRVGILADELVPHLRESDLHTLRRTPADIDRWHADVLERSAR